MLKCKYPNTFDTEDTAILGFKASVCLKPNTTPVFQKPYTVPYTMSEPVEQELDRLVQRGVLEPVIGRVQS